MTFKDHFSGHSRDYRSFRPAYPDGLFAYLASVAPARQRAWDCATGSGQAAMGLARYFSRVTATDASVPQLRQAVRHEKIFYLACLSEASCFSDSSVDLITVAQAFHWFDFERFHQEARRVLKDNGCLAVWCYGLCRIAPAIDAVVDHLYNDLIGPYWPPERRLIEEEYRSVSFPYEELRPPVFVIKVGWDLTGYIGYLNTWSAVKRYSAALGANPVDLIAGPLGDVWGRPEAVREISWPIHLRLGRA